MTLLTALLTCVTGLAHAQEGPEFAGAELADGETTPLAVEEATRSLEAELGGLFTSGNAVLYAVNAGVTFDTRWDRNKLAALASANLGAAVADTDGDGLLQQDERDVGFQENSRRVNAEVRYDRFLSKRDSLYVLAGGFHDIFAGYDLRSHEQVGYSRLFVTNEDSELRGEIGLDYAQEFRTTGDFVDILAARVLLGVKHKFNDNVSVSDTFEVYENLIQPEDVRILNTASFTSKLSDIFKLKLGHSLIFDNLPVEGFRKFDQTTTITLVASLI